MPMHGPISERIQQNALSVSVGCQLIFFYFHFTIFRRLKSCKVQSFNQKPEKRYKSTILCVGQLVNKRTRLNPVVCAYHAPLPPLVGAVEW